MTDLHINRVGNSYAFDYTGAGIEFRDVQEFMELIADLYERQGSVKAGDAFVVGKVEFHGHFKLRG